MLVVAAAAERRGARRRHKTIVPLTGRALELVSSPSHLRFGKTYSQPA
jgi:hypothetical protein